MENIKSNAQMKAIRILKRRLDDLKEWATEEESTPCAFTYSDGFRMATAFELRRQISDLIDLILEDDD